jgi:hypothetical protein
LNSSKLFRLHDSRSFVALHQFEFLTLGKVDCACDVAQIAVLTEVFFDIHQGVFRSIDFQASSCKRNLTGQGGFDISLTARLFQTVKSVIRLKDVQSCERKSGWEAGGVEKVFGVSFERSDQC